LLIAKETSRRLMLGTEILSPNVLPNLDPLTGQKPADLSDQYGAMILEADGFAEVFPEHKYLIVECLREMGFKTGMTGDGVNDAPALKRADVGIAVQGSTDAARAAADIVLTQPGLGTIVHGILIARCIFVRIRNFITYRIAATLQLLLFFFIAIFAFRPSEYEPEEMDSHTWPEFFHMPVIMLMLITLLNDGTLIAIGYDNVIPPATPAVWNLRVLFVIGTVLAVVACASSLLLLCFSLNSWKEGSFYGLIGIGGVSYGQITTSIFLKVAVSDFLTLFSARAGENWFWTSRPAPILLAAGALALSTSTLVACFWPNSRPDGIPTLGLERSAPYILPVFIWVYCLVWWVIQDAAKVYTYKFLKHFNVFQYNDTGMVPNHPSHQMLLDAQHAHKNAFSVSKVNTHVHFGNPGNIASGQLFDTHASPTHHSRKVYEQQASENLSPNGIYHGSEAHKFVSASALGGVSTSTGTAAGSSGKPRKQYAYSNSVHNGNGGPPILPYPANTLTAPDVALKKGE